MRLLRTPSPYADESLMGYLLRLAEANFHQSPYWILNNLGCSVDLKNKGWKTLINRRQIQRGFYKHVGKTHSELACLESGKRSAEAIKIFGHHISYDYVQFTNSRFCPKCLSEANYHRKIWDLIFVTACPFHKKLLVDTCPRCKNKIHWNRNKIGFCICGFELSYAESESICLEELKHNLILFEIFKVDTPYDLNLLMNRNPLRNIPLDIYINFLVSMMNFLSVKENNDIFSKNSSNKSWQCYSLKVVQYFDNYPHNITSLFKEGGTETENLSLYNKFLNAMKNSSQNRHLFFILIAFSEFENKTYNYPKFETIHRVKDNYIKANQTLENLGIDKEILAVLCKKGFVITLKEYLGFGENEIYITRKNLNIVREKIRTNVNINAVSNLLRLTHEQIKRLIKIGLLRPTKDPYFSDIMQMRFNLDDIESLIKKFEIRINQSLFRIKNGTVQFNKPKNELALILDSIEALDSQYDERVKQAEDSGLFPFPLSKSELEKYLTAKELYFARIEKANSKKIAKFLTAKLEQESKISTKLFNYEKSPFSINIDNPQLLALAFKNVLNKKYSC